MKNNNGFTLIELLAVVVILIIVLAIAVPTVTGIIKSSTKGAFKSDAKMVLQAIEYKKLNEEGFNPQEITKENMMNIIGLNSDNYKQVNISVSDGKTEIVLVGQNKWDGLTAYGTIRNMTVVDSNDYGDVLPIITILGDNPANIGQNTVYTDAGATAVNSKGESIPIASTVIRNGSNVIVDSIDTSNFGTYTITYTATDQSNHTTTSIRRVNVIDKVPPVISLLGNSSETMSLWGTYVDVGATATDNIDGDITSSIITTGNVFPNLAGTYTITYEVYDSSGNAATPITRTVEVLPDTTVFNYTGSTKTYSVPITGGYQVELWGAQGGSPGGKGGYTIGEIALTKGDTIYVNVGGTTSNYVAGWNGGGAGFTRDGNGYGGGGSTDIRIDGTTTNDRIMVAGGGGGNSCYNTYIGGAAGGLIGVNGNGAPVFYGTGGTQTAGGQTGTSGANLLLGAPGAFYTGGAASWCAGGGGGGYYGGGGAAYSNATGSPWGAGGGGSSFISGHEGCKAINASGANTDQPNHFSGHVFSNTEMMAGNAIMPAPAGGTETGHAGNGYAKIKSIGYANERPRITIIGSSFITIYQGSSYTDAGATALDDKDGNLTNKIIAQSNMNPNVPGTYEIIYSVKDSDGITGTVKRTIKIIAAETNFAYTGFSQSFVPIASGYFRVELWGAQGGNSGGKGSYTVGEIPLSPSDTVYVNVGGTTSSYNAGWNGGGTGSTNSQNGYGGGGGTDIRIGGTTNKDRIMVAGGGGGNSCYNTYIGGAGGDLSGLNGTGWAIFYGYGGTQTAGGQGGISGADIILGAPGTFYSGGAAIYCGGGGGGGYYGGGGAAYSNYSGGPCGSGGGGSSFISGYTGCNAIDVSGNHTGQPNHYSGYAFTNGQMTAGNASMPIPSGETETGHTGNGYARITFISR